MPSESGTTRIGIRQSLINCSSGMHRALYAYTASPDDPNEISFNKGDILDVIDGTGKWWQCQTPDGRTGSKLDQYPDNPSVRRDSD